jgi:hypothetical protein
VIQVTVRHQNFLERQPHAFDLREHAIKITARVYDRRKIRALIPKNGAVLLKRGDRNDHEFQLVQLRPDIAPRIS